MRIAFFVSEFPVVSETFVLNPIVGMLQRGHDVIIYTRECNETIALTHEEIEKYDLLARTRFDAPIPKPGLARVQSAIARLALWGWRHPMTTLNSLNLFRYGWSALTLQLVHERLPANRCVHEYDVIHCHFGRNGRRAIELRNLGV